MRFPQTLTLPILATGLVFVLPAWAQQKAVAPTFKSARADVAASLPRHGGVKPPLRLATLKVSATTAAGTRPGIDGNPAKPFTQEQVVSMVRDGFGDESGAKLIEQRGIDFAPSEDFYQTLKAAGASEAFLKALRAAVARGLSPPGIVAPTLRSAHADVAASLPRHGGVKPPLRPADLKVSATTAASEPASAKKPLNQIQVFALLVGQVPSHRVTMLVQERGIDFDATEDGRTWVHTFVGVSSLTVCELWFSIIGWAEYEVRFGNLVGTPVSGR